MIGPFLVIAIFVGAWMIIDRVIFWVFDRHILPSYTDDFGEHDDDDSEDLRNEIGDMMDRLHSKRLHVGYCSASRNREVGEAGAGCSCPLGLEIKQLRARAERAEKALSDLRCEADICLSRSFWEQETRNMEKGMEEALKRNPPSYIRNVSKASDAD